MMTTPLAQFKHAVREGWAAGDFPAVAQRDLWPLGQRIVERVRIRPGEEVLDVACGTGNGAIRAAQAGGRVVGVDLTPELFGAARQLATEAGVEVEWREGDAENLPFENERFDVVISTVGVMFAPRHAVAARELARVLRPGGRMALCNWGEESALTRIFRTVGQYLPPPPEGALPPWLWGSEAHVRSLFTDSGIDLEFERGVLAFPPFASGDENFEYHAARLGMMMKARALTEADGRWPELRAKMVALHEATTSSEYLTTLGHKRAKTR